MPNKSGAAVDTRIAVKKLPPGPMPKKSGGYQFHTSAGTRHNGGASLVCSATTMNKFR